jgi:hypothetical protein
LRERGRRKKEKENESKKKTELTFSLFPFRLGFSPLPL